MAVLINNNAASRLASSITAAATSLTVTTGEGAKFPAPTGGDWFPVTLLKADGSSEIARCTARSGDVLTVTRGQEGTSAIAFSAGDRVELRVTKAAMDEFVQGFRQTSQSDLTANALLIQGAHGLGAGASPNVSDLDSLAATTFLREAGATGSPAAGASTAGLHIAGATSSLALQLLGRVSADRFWLRRKNTVWSAAVELFHTAAACLIGVDAGIFGFAAGAGGTVTQPTNKSTGVGLNKPSGEIVMNAASLAAGNAVSFTLTNNKITANDLVNVEIKSGAATGGSYLVTCDQKASGSCRISVRNLTGDALAEALVLQFEVRKGAVA